VKQNGMHDKITSGEEKIRFLVYVYKIVAVPITPPNAIGVLISVVSERQGYLTIYMLPADLQD
jgi:hypothetical protein